MSWIYLVPRGIGSVSGVRGGGGRIVFCRPKTESNHLSGEWGVIIQRKRIVRCMPSELDLSNPSSSSVVFFYERKKPPSTIPGKFEVVNKRFITRYGSVYKKKSHDIGLERHCKLLARTADWEPTWR